MMRTSDLDFACNCDGMNEDEMYAKLVEQEPNVLEGKCLTCFHLSGGIECTLGCDIVQIDDVENYGCECWEDCADA